MKTLGPLAPMYWMCLPACRAALPAAKVCTTTALGDGEVTFVMKEL